MTGAVSGTYAFAPGVGELGLYAFHLCGIRPTALTQEHMFTLRMAANLMLGRWSSQGVDLWQVDLQTVALVEGQATYDVLPNTIVMLDTYVTQNTGAAGIDRIILPISRTEYASFPNKEQQGAPTTFWFDRLLAPTVTLWPVPNGEFSTMSYYRLRQSMDANFTDGQIPELPYYWNEAFANGLAQRLATIWAADRAAGLKALADESYQIAADQNIETATQYISPQIGSYYSP